MQDYLVHGGNLRQDLECPDSACRSSLNSLAGPEIAGNSCRIDITILRPSSAWTFETNFFEDIRAMTGFQKVIVRITCSWVPLRSNVSALKTLSKMPRQQETAHSRTNDLHRSYLPKFQALERKAVELLAPALGPGRTQTRSEDFVCQIEFSPCEFSTRSAVGEANSCQEGINEG